MEKKLFSIESREENFLFIMIEKGKNMLKQTLLAFSILAVAGTAAAADITNPFYLPQKGQLGSITTVGYDRNEIKNDVAYAKSHRLVAVEEFDEATS